MVDRPFINLGQFHQLHYVNATVRYFETYGTELARKNNLQLEWRNVPEPVSDAVTFADQAERSAQLRRLIMLAVDADPAIPIPRHHHVLELGNELSLSFRAPQP